MSDSSQNKAASSVDETAQRFVLWALAALQLSVESGGAGRYAVSLPEGKRAAWGGAESLQFAFDAERAAREPCVRLAAPGSRVYCWLVEQLRELGAVVHAAPKRQPAGVHEITQQLFESYQIDGGSVHLRGCTFEDHPLLRLTYRAPAEEGSQHERLVHVYANTDGAAVEQELLEALQVDDLAPAVRPPRLDEAEIQEWLEAGRRLAAERFGRQRGERGGGVLETAAIIWCKYAVGKLAFVIGPRSVESPFEGWAQFLAEGRIQPPPYACPLSGKASYHLAATDDGRITVREAIATCAESAARVLEGDLETCQATGRRALPAYLAPCPVSGQQVARSALVACAACGQRVSPTTLQKGCCSACRNAQPVSASDPRLAGVLQQHPKLERWRKWLLSETSAVHVLLASSLLSKLLLVVDKENRQLLRLASARRLGGTWTEVPPDKREQYLG